ncbi:cystatin-B-like isoform X2 [Thalassophryne amazonica]|uniref:cystatin-B-like isoform X2 n=1 Tax=Thalassophryne amazonica TaxID=390379 RepID=UPI001471F4E3|nr:cystatin-B-like isoform X2 [Thalassophryne amazonica]
MSNSKIDDVPQRKLVGGFSDVKDADEEIQQLCDQVKTQVEGKAGKNFAVFIAKQYKSQVVAGTNYIIKVYVGDDEYVHLQIYKKLPCYGGTVELSKVQVGKTLACPL